MPSSFGTTLDLSTLVGSNGFSFYGLNPGDRFGTFVGSVGDFYSNGFNYLIMSAPDADYRGKRNVGEIYVVYGGFIPSDTPSYDLSKSLDGFLISGIDAGGRFGFSASSAGDINGDGYADLIVGAPGADPDGKRDAGKVYVIFGQDGPNVPRIDLSNLSSRRGFVINGVNAGDNLGVSVSGTGDFNGDGFDDFIIGAPGADPDGKRNAGAGYVVFGRSGGFGSSVDLSTLDGRNGFVIKGANEGSNAGFSVSHSGSSPIVNSFAVDSSGNPIAGESHRIFSTPLRYFPYINLSDLGPLGTFPSPIGLTISGISLGNNSSFSADNAGDFNGDGFNDFIIGGSSGTSAGVSDPGIAYVVFGRRDFGDETRFELSTLDGTNGFAITGFDGYEGSVRSVSSAGDINGDGFDDLIIGASGGDPNGKKSAGKSYVLFGHDGGFSPLLDLSTFNSSLGFVINGIDAQDNSGFSVSGIGDLNRDGIDDLIIGAPGASPNGKLLAGEVYVILGRRTTTNAAPDAVDDINLSARQNRSKVIPWNLLLANDFDPNVGTVLSITSVGNAVGGTVALNGNTVVFTPNSNFSGTASFSYTLSDGSLTDTATVTLDVGRLISGDALSNAISGTSGDDILSGRQGNDTLRGGSGNDSLNGGANDDSLIGGDGLDTLRGGTGNDILAGRTGNDVLIGDAGTDTLIGGDNDDLLNGSTGTDTLIGGNGADTLIGGDDDDLLNGNDGADTLIGGNGADALVGGNGSDQLNGSDGDDILDGSLGADLLRGGAGQDTFVLARLSDGDTVSDFTDGVDKIGLSGGLTFERLRIVADGDNTLIRLAVFRRITLATLEGVSVNQITAADFVTV